MIERRVFVGGALASVLLGREGTALTQTANNSGIGTRLPPWSPGVLDLHHIDTGVGNATFVVGPDGTTILIDCGAIRGGGNASAPIRPDTSRDAGTWVARYAARHAKAAGRSAIDYAIATHVHPDHVGDVLPSDTRAPDGVVRTGLSAVEALLPIGCLIDRGYPDYDPLPPPDAPFAANYRAWLDARQGRGARVERIRVGDSNQILPRCANARTTFAIHAIAGGGRLRTGVAGMSRPLFPPRSAWNAGAMPTENLCSIALRIDYGPFRYFTGGDLTADTRDGAHPWLDAETSVTAASGPVDVATADHHGYFDACGAAFVRNLAAKAYVIQAWHATHPGMAQLQRLLDSWPGRTPRELYITRLTPESATRNARFLATVRSMAGHVIVRVAPGGQSYQLLATDSRDESDRVVSAGNRLFSQASNKTDVTEIN